MRPLVAAGIGEWMSKVCSGELPHCENVLVALMTKMAVPIVVTKIETVSVEVPTVPKCASCIRQDNLQLFCNNCSRYTPI